ncbi:MAG TPA: C-terminal binding protein [Chloroflexota bacterium]|nr:C-terminal binding protein [Chloroflexota bacterium]
MRVLVTDFMGEPRIEREELPGIEVDALVNLVDYPPTMDDVLRVIAERPAQALISWHEISYTPDSLLALAKAGVRGIVRAGVGYDNVHLAGARAAGIIVCNVPDYGTNEVADHAMALLLWALRCLRAAPPQTADREAWWDTRRFAQIPRLQGRTLALLGFGRIGQAVARRAQAFGFNVRWYDPYIPRGQDKATQTTRVESVAELLDGADALSVHCLLSDETRHVINASTLGLLPAHAVVVNTARGAVVDEVALGDALRRGSIAAAAVDVLEHEAPVVSALYDAYMRGELPTLLMTPHAAWYSQQSVVELRRKAAAEAGRIVRGEPVWNRVPDSY